LSDASPYVGPRPFENVDAALFYGREAESSALVSLIVSNAITLLYAQSGAGKSSLLNASVIPALRAREFEVLGPARVNGEPPAGAANAFIANALASLRGAAPHRDEGAPQSFAEVFGALRWRSLLGVRTSAALLRARGRCHLLRQIARSRSEAGHTGRRVHRGNQSGEADHEAKVPLQHGRKRCSLYAYV